MRAAVVVDIAKGVVWYAISVSAGFSAAGGLAMALLGNGSYWWGFFFGSLAVAALGAALATGLFGDATRLDGSASAQASDGDAAKPGPHYPEH